MHICGLNKTTLLDYPDLLAAVIFTGGCNFRCPFCQNSSLVLPDWLPQPMSERKVLDFLEQRSGILEGVCISGGEPTMQEDLPRFLKSIKELGLKIKLDTNGSNPKMLALLLQDQSVDYIAMDIKNSLESYSLTIGIPGFSTKAVEQSASLLRSCQIPYEFRTTVVKELHTASDMRQMGEWLQGSPALFLQPFQNSSQVLSQGLSPHGIDTMREFQEILSAYIKRVEIRGMA